MRVVLICFEQALIEHSILMVTLVLIPSTNFVCGQSILHILLSMQVWPVLVGLRIPVLTLLDMGICPTSTMVLDMTKTCM